MSKQTEALKLALEDLLMVWKDRPSITAIREALAEQETVLPGGGHVPAVPVAVYGYCPECGGAGVMRERRPNGDDKCTNGHKYPSSKALAEQPAQQQELEHDEHGPECSPEEFLLRGILASELKCWHRLTADEAQNLVAFVQNMPAKPAQQRPQNCGTGYCSCIECLFEQPAQQQEPEPDRVKFERHWRKTRGEKKANRELPRHPLQPQTYIQDSANRHWVTWQAAVRSVAPPAQRKPLTHEQRVDLLARFEAHKHEWHASAILIDMVEAAHGITGEKT